MITGTLARTRTPLSATSDNCQLLVAPHRGHGQGSASLRIRSRRLVVALVRRGVSAASIGGRPAKATVTVSMLTASTPGWPGDGSVPGSGSQPRNREDISRVQDSVRLRCLDTDRRMAVGAMDLLLDGNNTNDVVEGVLPTFVEWRRDT